MERVATPVSLTMERVPTPVSRKQEQNSEHSSLATCCLSGVEFPSYNFARRSILHKRTSATSELETVVLAMWEARSRENLFKYDVTACETKTLAGENGFVAQLNEGRQKKKRPTEFLVDQVLQPFDPMKWNFTKAKPNEVLFTFEESMDGHSKFFESAPMEGSSPNVVMINVSPIDYGHILLLPRVMDYIPQRIDPHTLLLAFQMIAEVNNPGFRVGFNSLGAYATINQLHFQAYFLDTPFALERAPSTLVTYIHGEGGVKVSEVVNYPVRCLVFEIGSSLEELAEEVGKACIVLQVKNIPYNVLIADCGARVFVIPQCFAERKANGEVDEAILDIGVNPAVWEISGHIILFREEDYEKATEDYAWKLLAEVSLSKERFEDVKRMCLPPEEDPVTDHYLTIAKLKAKVRQSMGLQTVCNECISQQA